MATITCSPYRHSRLTRVSFSDRSHLEILYRKTSTAVCLLQPKTSLEVFRRDKRRPRFSFFTIQLSKNTNQQRQLENQMNSHPPSHLIPRHPVAGKNHPSTENPGSHPDPEGSSQNLRKADSLAINHLSTRPTSEPEDPKFRDNKSAAQLRQRRRR